MLLLVLFHTIHHPIRMMLRILLFTFLSLHRFLHLKLFRNIDTLTRSWSVIDGFHPFLDTREWIRWDAGPLGPVDPAKTGKVCDSVSTANSPQALSRLLLRGQSVLQNLVKSSTFGLVPLDSILDLLGRIPVKVVCLSLHRTDATLHPDEPLDNLPVLGRIVGKRHEVLGVVFRAEVQHNRGAFEDTFGWLLSIVDYGRDAAIGCGTR